MKKGKYSAEKLLQHALALVKINKKRLIKVRIESLKLPVTKEDALQIEFVFIKKRSCAKAKK